LLRVAKIASISRQQSRPVLDAGGVGREARILHPLGVAEHRGQLHEEPVVAGGDDDRAGLRLERLERHHAVAARAMALGHHAGRAEARVVTLEPRQTRLE
jgi:hypothetical protein